MTLALQVLKGGEDTYRTGTMIQTLEHRGKMLVDQIQTELTPSRILNVTTTHTFLQFRIPVDYDNDNDVVDNANQVEYGYIDPATNTPQLNWSAEYQFVSTEILSEAAMGVDINRDNALNDTYSRGTLDKVIRNAAGVEVFRVTLDTDIILRSAPLDGDVDGNLAGVQDPLFYRTDYTGAEQPLTGNVIQINVWHGREGDRGEFFLRNNKQRIILVNTQ